MRILNVILVLLFLVAAIMSCSEDEGAEEARETNNNISGNVYVADTWNHRVQKFDSDGNFLLKWGTKGYGDGQFHYPRGIAVDGLGNVYVVDAGNYRIQKFDSEGNFLAKWGTRGKGDGEFEALRDIAVDVSWNVLR